MNSEVNNLETAQITKSLSENIVDISWVSLNLKIIRFSEFAFIFIGGLYLLSLFEKLFFYGASTFSLFLAFLFYLVALFACIQTAWCSNGTISENFFGRYRII